MEQNTWIEDLHHWCPAQIYYYFIDSDGGRWCIYLRWSGCTGDEPWQAELYQCDDDWEFKTDCERVNLLEEKEHVPGTVTGFYRDEEYPYLKQRVLELVRERFPDLKDKLK